MEDPKADYLDSNPLYQAVMLPASSTLLILLACIWVFYSSASSEVVRTFCFSYNQVVSQGQFYRLFSSPFIHVSPLHLLFNCLSLWSLRSIEFQYGFWFYLNYSLFFLIASQTCSLLFLHLLPQRFSPFQNAKSIGYSGILFAWITFKYLSYPPQAAVSFMGLFQIPAFLFPFVSLVTIQLIVPSASFLGHFSGMLVGFLFSLGFFAGLTPYWSVIMVFWSLVAILFSLHTSGVHSCRCLQPPSLHDPEQQQEWLRTEQERTDRAELRKEKFTYDLPSLNDDEDEEEEEEGEYDEEEGRERTDEARDNSESSLLGTLQDRWSRLVRAIPGPLLRFVPGLRLARRVSSLYQQSTQRRREDQEELESLLGTTTSRDEEKEEDEEETKEGDIEMGLAGRRSEHASMHPTSSSSTPTSFRRQRSNQT